MSQIPANLRVPLVYIEIDNTGASQGLAELQQRIFIPGLATGGCAAIGEPYRVTSDEQAMELWGADSMLTAMVKMARKADPFTEMWGVALTPGGSTAEQPLAIAIDDLTDPIESGMLHLMIGGEPLDYLVEVGDEDRDIAAGIAAQINAGGYPVTAEATDGDVKLTCRWAGETGDDIDVLLNYYPGQQTPAGVVISVKCLEGGSGNPDISEAIAAMGDLWFTAIVMPFTDTANMNALRDELLERWGPVKMIEGIAYCAYRGTMAEAATFGNARNDFLYTSMATNISPQPAYLWAASYAATGARELGVDPARPLQFVTLPGILPVNTSARWELNERNLLLYDGMATHTVGGGDVVQIEREISMYQTNATGAPDDSYLDITTPATLGFVRHATKVRIQRDYPRHKLADDGTKFAPGQPVVTPEIIRDTLLDVFKQLEARALVENFDQYKTDLIVERDDSDRNAVNVISHPDLVNQFRKLAMAIQFKL
ncbi:phage tail protein [Agarivorans sp. B2Z047]|uniref:phage tail sheath subtilisin-like domain-containing protein n=1 Tax=Agarivorans sp. B2Z047 TaxID=2652721 RepID=UPI00128E2F41|nr:phage tail sheath subtilisin-like domain-containing protein [Agarivorans sp. B2Z047]MPW31794.1 phage tail protein [Agarivorans sp. B2Z047]UQN43741.1 phage tail sheath subtilisin-like domain-containing protein [Agarivorans sp. B2Z047]